MNGHYYKAVGSQICAMFCLTNISNSIYWNPVIRKQIVTWWYSSPKKNIFGLCNPLQAIIWYHLALIEPNENELVWIQLYGSPQLSISSFTFRTILSRTSQIGEKEELLRTFVGASQLGASNEDCRLNYC